MKCPNCGVDLPSPSHFGLKASPKNYITPQVQLTPGKKYLRTFAILFYPERDDPELGHLSPCLVIASEEYPKDTDKSYPFISGAKFYQQALDSLERVTEDILLSHIAFKSLLLKKPLPTLFQSRLRSLYFDPQKREELELKVQAIYNRMKICSDVTERENNL